MKIAFINDPCERLGVEYIAAVLKKKGHEVKVFLDPQLFNDVYISFKTLGRIFDYKKFLLRELKAYHPDLIGISTDTEHYQWACLLAKMIKEELGTPIIFGGIHPTSVPERVIQNDCVDMVCVGEGEYPMLELADSMEKGRIDTSIKNIWFKKNGSVIRNDIRPLIEHLDTLPIPDHDVFYETSSYFKKGYYIVTSRGCPYSCSYCSHSYLQELYRGKGIYLRQRSVSNVLHELHEAKNKYKMDLVVFLDDCFGYDPNWLEEFSERYRKNIGIRFTCSLHPGYVSKGTVESLKSAGCCQVTLGIQSLDETIRSKLLNRNISNDAILRAIKLIRDFDLRLLVDNIFGFPNQEVEEYLDSVSFYALKKPQRIFFYKLKYYPNTALTRKAVENGFISSSRLEDILEGRDKDGVYFNSIIKDKTIENKTSAKIRILLYLLDCLPAAFIRYVIKKRLYRFLPAIFNPAVFISLRTMVATDPDSRVLRSRIFSRYTYFIKKILKAQRDRVTHLERGYEDAT